MAYSPMLSSAFNDTYNRSKIVSPFSGMCTLCTEDCPGTCEIGISAVRGAQTVYPTNTGNNQVASQKDYPLDFSCFNINGRVFGAEGAPADSEKAAIFNVKLDTEYGRTNKVKMTMPIILPALIKLNWVDYFGGAAMAGVSCVIGEGSTSKDDGLRMEDGKIVQFSMLTEILDAFRRYDRGFGQIILQCNVEDDMRGLPEYALELGAEAIEFKFGQSAKGTQPARFLKGGFPEAKEKKLAGCLVSPDPDLPGMEKAWKDGVSPNFYSYDRLPMWNEEYLPRRIAHLREKGLKNVYLKMAGYDPEDLERVLRIASTAEVDMVTFDGAGGGSGYSPCKMMNEWCMPTVLMEAAVVAAAKKLKKEGLELPAIAVAGGLVMEDQAYKALALGDGIVSAVGICRSSMAAAMTGKTIGMEIARGAVPPRYRDYGNTVEEIFGDLPDLRGLYGKEANGFSTGAIGVFSYLRRVAFGLQHFAALNRKFDIRLSNRRDLIPLTHDAAEILNR